MTSRSWGGEGGGYGFCDDRTKALVIKHVTMGGGGGPKNVQNCVTSLMDDPLGDPYFTSTYNLDFISFLQCCKTGVDKIRPADTFCTASKVVYNPTAYFKYICSKKKFFQVLLPTPV